MDLYHNKYSYFQNEYILEEQYISYNENNYDYGNNWEVQGWDGGIEIGPEYDEELGHGLEVEERFGEGVGVREEIRGEWEEEGRGEGGEYECDGPGQVYQDYQPEMQMDNEIGYKVPYGGSTLLKRNIMRCYSELKVNIPTRNCIRSLRSQDLCK